MRFLFYKILEGFYINFKLYCELIVKIILTYLNLIGVSITNIIIEFFVYKQI